MKAFGLAYAVDYTIAKVLAAWDSEKRSRGHLPSSPPGTKKIYEAFILSVNESFKREQTFSHLQI